MVFDVRKYPYCTMFLSFIVVVNCINSANFFCFWCFQNCWMHQYFHCFIYWIVCQCLGYFMNYQHKNCMNNHWFRLLFDYKNSSYFVIFTIFFDIQKHNIFEFIYCFLFFETCQFVTNFFVFCIWNWYYLLIIL